MKCIECAFENVESIYDLELTNPERKIIGFKCTNCGLEWSIDEHIDDMSYCIQQINIQQQLIQQLQTDNYLMKKQLEKLLKTIEG